jgi:outer membrane protein assembly factor BamB
MKQTQYPSNAKLNVTLHSFYRLSMMLVLVINISQFASAQQAGTSAGDKPVAPEILPGKGPGQFDFFYSGEAKARNMYIVRNGKITWSYIDTVGKGEISDAVLMTNGNILFAHQFGVTLINPDKKVLWNYDAPAGSETHTAQPIGKGHVVFIQNGNPAKLFVMSVKTSKTEKEFTLQVKNPTSIHGQFRHARLTKAGTIMVAHMDMGKVSEYDIDGKELWSIDVPGVWSAEPLKNGNILVAGNKNYVQEINRKGEVVWACTQDDLPDYKVSSPQIALRLANGNTLVNEWFNQWSGKTDPNNYPVQALEITPDKKVVGALHSWENPLNLGPSTTIQLLDNRGGISEKIHFGVVNSLSPN